MTNSLVWCEGTWPDTEWPDANEDLHELDSPEDISRLSDAEYRSISKGRDLSDQSAGRCSYCRLDHIIFLVGLSDNLHKQRNGIVMDDKRFVCLILTREIR